MKKCILFVYIVFSKDYHYHLNAKLELEQSHLAEVSKDIESPIANQNENITR